MLYEITHAAVHDSQVINEIIAPHNTNADVYADSAYRSAAQEEKFVADGYRSNVHHKGTKSKPLSEFKQEVHHHRSKVRAMMMHIFGNQMMMMGSKLMRCIGMTRVKACIGLRNLVYNMHRFVFLSTLKTKSA